MHLYVPATVTTVVQCMCARSWQNMMYAPRHQLYVYVCRRRKISVLSSLFQNGAKKSDKGSLLVPFACAC
jgi:hypothetical protein